MKVVEIGISNIDKKKQVYQNRTCKKLHSILKAYHLGTYFY